MSRVRVGPLAGRKRPLEERPVQFRFGRRPCRSFEMLGRASSRIERTPGLGMERWWPKGMIVVFAAFHAVGHVGSILRLPFLIDDNGQVATMPDRVHGRE